VEIRCWKCISEPFFHRSQNRNHDALDKSCLMPSLRTEGVTIVHQVQWPFSQLIMGRIKGRVKQRLAASFWLLGKPKLKAVELSGQTGKSSEFDAIWGQFDVIRPRFKA
jgi:hypothetical protein